MSSFAPVDAWLGDRIIQAPWLPPVNWQSPSVLLSNNLESITYMLEQLPGELWHRDNLNALTDSGWLDYLRSYNNLDSFPTDLFLRLVVINRVVYVKIWVGFISVYNIKFFQVPKTAPFLFAKSDLGYDYLLPVDITAEFISTAMHRRWGHLIEGLDPEAFNWPREVRNSYFARHGVMKMKNDPVIKQISDMLNSRSLLNYGIRTRFYVFTYPNLTESVSALPGEYHNTGIKVVRDALDDVFAKLEPYRDLLKDPIFSVIPDSYLDTPSAVNQYTLPEASRDNVAIAHLIINSGEINPHKYHMGDYYSEAVMALASRDLVNNKLRATRDDFMNVFVDNLSPTMPYLRYPIMFFGADWRSVEDEEKGPGLYGYQQQYESKSRSPPYRPAYVNSFDLTDGDVEKQLAEKPVERQDRANELFESRILPILSKFWNKKMRSAHYYGGDEMYYDAVGGVGAYSSSKEQTEKKFPELAGIRIAYEASKQHLTEPEYLSPPIIPSFRYISIHGISFRTDDLVRIFNLTPLAGAVSLGSSEYNPEWLSYKDVRLVADLLTGRVMPYTFYTHLSQQAYIVMSGEFTFLYFYQNGSISKYVDKAFVLGTPMIQYLQEFKQKQGSVSIEMEMFLSLVE